MVHAQPYISLYDVIHHLPLGHARCVHSRACVFSGVSMAFVSSAAALLSPVPRRGSNCVSETRAPRSVPRSGQVGPCHPGPGLWMGPGCRP